MIWAVSLVLFLWGFWTLYVLVMGVYRAHLAKRLNRLAYVMGLPWVVLGYLVDVFAQFTVATVFFLDPPRRGEWLVTDRLKRYSAGPWNWRKAKADWICTHLLDPFDPTDNHC